jgi:hypothetical protein
MFAYAAAERLPEKIWAISASDGRFHFSIPKQPIEEASDGGNPWDHTYVMAAAEGYGFAWARLRPQTAGNMTLRLVHDDVPLECSTYKGNRWEAPASQSSVRCLYLRAEI